MALIGLTVDELQHLTGFKYPSKQIEALISMDIDFRIRPDGTPFVTRISVDGIQSREQTDKPLIFNALK